MSDPSPTLPLARPAPAVEIVEPLGAPLPATVLASPALTILDDLAPAASPVARRLRRPRVNPLVEVIRFVASGIEWLFGLAVVMLGLAVLAAVPVLQFLSLGYLLEATGRVARSGRLRDGFVGVRTAARLGGIVLWSWLLLLPVRFVSDLATSAAIIDPRGRAAELWRLGLYALIAVTALHILTAVARGGKLRHFLWPFNFVWVARRVLRGGYYAEARDAVWDAVAALRLPYYFWLGFRGFVAALAWLAVPISLLALGRVGTPAAGFLAFMGGVLLAVVLVYLPFLQARMAAENRLGAAFEVLAARREYRRAPWAFAFSFFVTLLFALPLYLLKIEIVPREAAWLPSLVFIAFIYPARLLTGWALGRARHRETPRHWFFRWTGRLPFLPAAAFYVLVVFFTQYTSWNGVWSLYEQHAFLVPVPFFGL